jgi:hypothetical protein
MTPRISFLFSPFQLLSSIKRDRGDREKGKREREKERERERKKESEKLKMRKGGRVCS